MFYLSFFERVLILLERYGLRFLEGMGVTLLLAIVGIIVGLILGLGLALLRNLKAHPGDNAIRRVLKASLRTFAFVYIEVFRGTPMMVQALIIYFGGKMIGIPWTYLTAGLFIISINTAAYMAEIIRAGINGVDLGQNEAARSLGMSDFQTMVYVVFPQALKNAIPTIGNELIVNIKDSSVLNVISVTELFMVANIAATKTYYFIESYFIIALIYLVLTVSVSLILKKVEKRINAPYVAPKLVGANL